MIRAHPTFVGYTLGDYDADDRVAKLHCHLCGLPAGRGLALDSQCGTLRTRRRGHRHGPRATMAPHVIWGTMAPHVIWGTMAPHVM